MNDNSTDFRLGDIVDITIKGVRITRPHSATSVTITDEHGTTYQMPPQAAVERVAPAEWPPKPGDLWRDNGDELWFAVSDGDVLLIPSYPIPNSRTGREPQRVLKTVGPLTLVHRDGGAE